MILETRNVLLLSSKLKQSYSIYSKHVAKNKQQTSANLPDNVDITKTYLNKVYNFDPFNPLFYIVKLGFTGVYIIFLISVHKEIVGTR